ncbi:MAG: amidase [Pseudomonadota bacterium]
MTTPLHYRPLSDVVRDIKSGALTSSAVTAHMLARIAAEEPALRSYALVMAEQAQERAAQLDEALTQGNPAGPLHGVPIAVKDLVFTAGLPTASGTVVMRDFVPNYNATVYDKLLNAGAVIIGKTQLTEGAFGEHHPDIDPPVNPYGAELWTGVSSSGSGAAVAAGLAYGALGSDTGGSIRFPSACCGLVGIKPTYGRVSRYGVFPLAESLDHIGPMTRTVEDAARLLGVLAGQDANDPTTLTDAVPNYLASRLPDTLRIGVDWAYVERGVDDDVVANVREACQAFADLGAEIVPVSMPGQYRMLAEQWGLTCGVECAQAHADYYPQQKGLYGPVLANLLDLGLSVTEPDYQALEQLRRAFAAQLEALLQAQADVLIMPCLTSATPTVADVATRRDEEVPFINFTAPTDYSGHPSITLPMGLDGHGRPRALQLIGRLLGEATLVAAGVAFESAVGRMPHPA